eukprot:7379454-Prymnesium_polylepis.1
MGHAFDAQGNVLVHLVCLQARFNVGHHFTTDLHRGAVERASAKRATIPKKKVLSLGLTDEEVIRPEGSLGSLATYLATLKEEDPVTVVSQAGKHGLRGQASNASSSKERALFIEFVEQHRSPTGRTQDHAGRYHGAEFYLMSKLTTIKTQSARITADPDAVLECVFKKALLGLPDAATLKPPSGTSVMAWLKEDFGVKSEHGHTVLFPHKSDACSICSSYDVDIDSTKMSIKRHEQQTSDAGSIERQARSASLRLASLSASLSASPLSHPHHATPSTLVPGGAHRATRAARGPGGGEDDAQNGGERRAGRLQNAHQWPARRVPRRLRSLRDQHREPVARGARRPRRPRLGLLLWHRLRLPDGQADALLGLVSSTRPDLLLLQGDQLRPHRRRVRVRRRRRTDAPRPLACLHPLAAVRGLEGLQRHGLHHLRPALFADGARVPAAQASSQR